jgi:hypothetical protein
MTSKSNQSNLSINKNRCQLPIDNCHHSISTSLRDLRNKYKDLRTEQTAPAGALKKPSLKKTPR